MENCRVCEAPPVEFLVSWYDRNPSYVCRVCGAPHPERRTQIRYDSSTFQTLTLDRVGRPTNGQ
jgi:hypothetical protein